MNTYILLFCIELKVSTVVRLIAKFHDMSTVTFPWQHNWLQVLFDLVVHSVGVSKYGQYTAKIEESVSNSGATNNAFFILGRWRCGNEYVAMVTS